MPVAAATGIAVSRVNNYVHGNYRTIRPDHLEKLARAVARTARERSELIRGYLLDLLAEVLQSEIRFRGVGPGGRESGRIQPDWSRLPATTARALAGMQALSRGSAKARVRVQWFLEILAEAHGT